MLHDLVILPLKEFFAALNAGERSVLYILLAAAATLGFVLGRRRSPAASGYRRFGAWRFPSFQNSGEELVSRVLLAHFRAPDYHLMNHVTLRMADGTTQVDHILVSRFGVFVIETKDYSGWIFANESGAKWTRVHYRLKHRFQNPIRQNFRHVLAVQDLLEFVPRDAIRSVVVLCGTAEFKTDVPDGVMHVDEIVEYLKQHTVELMALNRMQYVVGRLETAGPGLARCTCPRFRPPPRTAVAPDPRQPYLRPVTSPPSDPLLDRLRPATSDEYEILRELGRDRTLPAGGALAFAQRNGVVHRDIKPANVTLDEDRWAE